MITIELKKYYEKKLFHLQCERCCYMDFHVDSTLAPLMLEHLDNQRNLTLEKIRAMSDVLR